MKVLVSTLAVLLGLAVLSSLAAGAYVGIGALVAALRTLDPQLVTVLGVSLAALLASAGVIARSIRATQDHADEALARSQRAELYQVYVELMGGMLRRARVGMPEGDPEPNETLEALDQMLVLRASPGVIRAHALLRRSLPGCPREPEFGMVLLEMRRDLGSGTRGLAADDLQRLVLEDSREDIPGNSVADPVLAGLQPALP